MHIELFIIIFVLVSASVKLAMYDDSNSMTQKKTHHVENNIKGVIKGN